MDMIVLHGKLKHRGDMFLELHRRRRKLDQAKLYHENLCD